jgi:hypothetical protein
MFAVDFCPTYQVFQLGEFHSSNVCFAIFK